MGKFKDSYKSPAREDGTGYLSEAEVDLLIDEGSEFLITSVRDPEPNPFDAKKQSIVFELEIEGEPRLKRFGFGDVQSRDHLLLEYKIYLDGGGEPELFKLEKPAGSRVKLLVFA